MEVPQPDNGKRMRAYSNVLTWPRLWVFRSARSPALDGSPVVSRHTLDANRDESQVQSPLSGFCAPGGGQGRRSPVLRFDPPTPAVERNAAQPQGAARSTRL